MIGNISQTGSQTGKYIAVTGGPGSNYVNNAGYMGVGQLQYNTGTQRLEVYNGQSWQPFNLGHYYVGLNPEAEDLLDWARNKMREERELERLAKDNVAINDLLQQVKEKQHQIKMVQTLIRKEETV
jgi:hypothetical protein